MNKALTLLAAISLGGLVAQAVPAKPGLRTIVQPDGTTVQAELRGDEYCSFYVSEDGIPMRMAADGFLRYVVADNEGNIALTANAAAATPELAMKAFARIGAAERVRMNAVPASLAAETVAENVRALSEGEAESPTAAWKGIGLMGRQNFPVIGDIKSVVILVSYSDVDFTVSNPLQYYTDMLNKPGFDQYSACGSARDFFVENSNGLFKPTFDVYGPVQLAHNRAWYGAESGSSHDIRPANMVTEACAALDGQVDFSQYDLDGDGIIDNIYVIYAGQGQASYGGPDTVWPHSSTIINGPIHDGVRVGRYATSNEWEYQRPDGIGTFVHEFSHVMGLPDLYSTTYVNTVTPGMWSTMDQGPYNGDGCRPPYYSSYERNALGWIDLLLLEDAPASIQLPAISENVAYLIPTVRTNEFYLLENRQQTGWDTTVPGHGMLVWHVDFDQTVFNRNNVNNDENHQYVDIVERRQNPNSGSKSIQATYPFPGSGIPFNRKITPTSKPNLTPWFGPVINHEITNIYEREGIITFDVAGGGATLDVPVANEATAVGATGFTANWNSVDDAAAYLISVCGSKTSSESTQTLDFGDASTTTVQLPEGWTFSGEASHIYTSAATVGNAAPSLKFDSNGIELVSPMFEGNVATIEFYARYMGLSSQSALIIQGRSNESEAWKTIDAIDSFERFTSMRSFSFEYAEPSVRQIRIVFYTSKGRMALDDLAIGFGGTYSVPVEGYEAKRVEGATAHSVILTPEGTGIYTYSVKAVDAAGKATAASNTITVDLSEHVAGVGNVAVGNDWNISVVGSTAFYTGTPGAVVNAVNASGAVVATALADGAGNATIALPATGFYILCAPEGNVKAIVK